MVCKYMLLHLLDQSHLARRYNCQFQQMEEHLRPVSGLVQWVYQLAA